MSFKFAASDFDGTLFRNEKISAEDIAAIKSWRAAGNMFGLVTGRPFVMLVPYFKKFGLDVDFVIGDNGAIIHGSNGQIIFQSEISKKILHAMTDEPCAAKSFHFLFETADDMFCIILDERSWLLREKLRWDFPLTLIDSVQVIDSLPQINQLALGFTTTEEAQAVADVLNRKFGDKIFAQRNSNSVDVTPAGVNKSAGVEKILELMNWRDAEVFVIGDEANDLPMIKKFGGYTVATAKGFVKREAKAVFDSVGEMLQKNLDKI